MNAVTLEDMYNRFTSEPGYTLDYALRFFEEYAAPFNSVNTFDNDDELNIYIKLVWHYLHVLFQKNMFGETSDKSQNFLKFIDKEAERLNLNITGDEWYLGIILFKGMATYRLRKYKLATGIFRQLSDLNNQSEDFKNWLKYSRYQEHKWISRTISITCVILFLSEKIFAKYMTFSLSMTILVIAIAGLISSLFYDLYAKRIFKKA
jgi:hypothetical protein